MVTSMSNVQSFDLQSYMNRLKKATSETEIEKIKSELDTASTLHIQNIQGDNYSENVIDYLKQIESCADDLLKSL